MNYCPECAARLVREVPPGDNRLRSVCPACGTIQYRNPRVIVGVVCTWDERILLCRRAIEPRHGFWTLPAGFLECGESTADGALRETHEEAGAEVTLHGLYAQFDVLHAEQVHLFYRGVMRSPDLDPGVESLEARLFHADDLPWGELAFQTVRRTLEWYLEDRARGSFQLRSEVLMPTPKADDPKHRT